MRVLVIEDDFLVADAVRRALVAAGFAADLVGSAEAAKAALTAEPFDLAIIDIGLPRENGMTLLQGLRSRGKTLPVLMLTARDGVDDRVTALDLGADDYLTKPFQTPELIARCRALIRRANAVASAYVVFGNLEIDIAHRKVAAAGEPLSLTQREWAILECLTLNAGRVVYLTAVSPLTDAYDQALLDSALVIAAHVRRGADGRLELAFPMDALDVLRADSRDSIYFRVSSADGTFVAGDADLPEPDTSRANPAHMDSSYRGAPVRLVGYRTFAGDSPVTVTMAETTHKRLSTRNRILTSSVAIDLVVLTVVLALILVGAKLSLKPLRLVEDQIASRSAHDLTPLSIRRVPEEIQRVVSALNRLFAVVSGNAARERRFLDSAAHQLRTPLAGIQAQLELLCADERDPVRKERLYRVLEAARRVGRTARQLLTLARADESTLASSALEEVDLASLAESVVADFLSAAERAGVDLGASLAPASMTGVGWLLAEALRSLVDNAIAHTPPGGSVTVACGAADGAPYLEVVDDGIGIPASERERVLERFYRGSNARGGGSGLGLAIAREVAAMHRGDLKIDTGPGGRGTSVRITFARSRGAYFGAVPAGATALSG